LEGYLRTESKGKKKISYRDAINTFAIIIKNAILGRDELLKFTANTAELPKAADLPSLLLLIFTKEETKQEKMTISAAQHREHLDDHVRSLAALCEGIRIELLG